MQKAKGEGWTVQDQPGLHHQVQVKATYRNSVSRKPQKHRNEQEQQKKTHS
jgi:hypothetical protein